MSQVKSLTLLFNRLRPPLLVSFFVLAVSLGGCSLVPLYREDPEQVSFREDLALIAVVGDKTPLDFELVQQLRWFLHGGGEQKGETPYQLRLEGKTKVEQTAIERATGDPRSHTLTLTVKLALFPEGEQVPAYGLPDRMRKGADIIDKNGKRLARYNPQDQDKLPEALFFTELKVYTSFDATNQRYGREVSFQQARARSAEELARRFVRELTIQIRQGKLQLSDWK